MTRTGGFGATLTISGSAIAHITNFEFPEFVKVLAEITAHDSPGGYAEHISTRKRRMEAFTVELTWDTDEATHAAIVAAFDSDNTVPMVASDPLGSEDIAFDAHIGKLGRIAEQEEGYSCNVEIQPTGLPIINGGS